MGVRRPSNAAITAGLLMTGMAIASLRLSGPPRAAGDVTRDDAFSSARAMPHVRALAEAPHPMGTPEHARVRDRLIARLEALGFTVERQHITAARTTGNARTRGTIAAGLVENLLVRIPGRANTGAVLLASHYDSVAAGPGAADATSAVASVLETLRALKAGPPLRNDVIALFTDGEEDGLLGAEAFVSRHPRARDVRAVLNFEARGNRGAVQMFETTPGNGAVVAAWAAAVPRPAGTSLAYEVYRRLPNDTDFTEFKRMNAVGLGFAFIGNLPAYHTPHDSPDNLDQWSVQGVGEAALGLTRRLGDENLDPLAWRTGDDVFFSLPGGLVIRYSTMWAVPLVAAGFVAWAWLVVRLRRRGDTSFGGVALAAVVMAALAGGLGWAGLKVPAWLAALQAATMPVATPATSQAYALGIVCAVLAVWSAAWALMRIKFAAHSLASAGVLVLWLIGGAVAWALPGGSYLLTWPALVALPVLWFWRAAAGKSAAGAGRAAAVGVLAAPALCIIVPTAVLLFDALLLTPEGVAGIVALVTAGVFALGVAVECVTEGRRWWPAVVFTLLAAGATAAGVVTSAHGERHPRPENLAYALDADAGTACWATTVDPLTPWLESFVTATPARGPLPGFAAVTGQQPFLSAAAPSADIPGPAVVLERQAAENGSRELALRVSSPRGGRAMSLRLPGREVLETRINGRSPSGGAASSWVKGRWALEFANVPAGGLEVVVRVAGTEPVEVVAMDRSHGLPAQLTAGRSSRPQWSHQVHRGDQTLVKRTFRF